MPRILFFVYSIACALAGWLTGCAPPTPEGSARPMLFAAASTTDAVLQIAADFRRETAMAVHTNFAGSSTLATQIEAGAPADLFLSASVEWADRLTRAGLVARRVDLLGNRLVAIVPALDGPVLHGPGDLTGPDIRRLALADPGAVPAGIYARRALETLGVWTALAGRVVRGADVRQALLYVERGEAEAGIVYATDAARAPAVRVAFPFDPALGGPIRYPLVLLKSAEAHPAAIRLYEAFQAPAARVVFEEYGFDVLPAPGAYGDNTPPAQSSQGGPCCSPPAS